MKKINILFTAVLCATITLFVSCGDSKKTKYTFAPVWDSSITEKDTTGIVGHTFKYEPAEYDWIDYFYFSEAGFYASERQGKEHEDELKEDLQILYNASAELKKKKRNLIRVPTEKDFENEKAYEILDNYEDYEDYKDELKSKLKNDWLILDYSIDKERKMIINIMDLGRSKDSNYYYEINKGEPVLKCIIDKEWLFDANLYK